MLSKPNHSDKKIDPSEPIWVWGLHVVEEITKAQASAIEEIRYLPSFSQKKINSRLIEAVKSAGISCQQVQDFQKLPIPKDTVHQGITALVRPFWMVDFHELAELTQCPTPSLLLICDQIMDPQNLGAIIRSAVAFGVDAILLPERSTAAVTGTVVKASSGAIAHARLCRVGNLVRAMDQLKKWGVWITALSPDGTNAIWDTDFSGHVAIIVGSEGHGIRELVKKHADFTAYIPQAEAIASMNAAAAASVCLYEVMRQRQH